MQWLQWVPVTIEFISHSTLARHLPRARPLWWLLPGCHGDQANSVLMSVTYKLLLLQEVWPGAVFVLGYALQIFLRSLLALSPARFVSRA